SVVGALAAIVDNERTTAFARVHQEMVDREDGGCSSAAVGKRCTPQGRSQRGRGRVQRVHRVEKSAAAGGCAGSDGGNSGRSTGQSLEIGESDWQRGRTSTWPIVSEVRLASGDEPCISPNG